MKSLKKIYEDMLPGGKGDKVDPSKFDKKQILKGVKVELEHTNDIKVALEICLDHLSEMPDYYDRLETIEPKEF